MTVIYERLVSSDLSVLQLTCHTPVILRMFGTCVSALMHTNVCMALLNAVSSDVRLSSAQGVCAEMLRVFQSLTACSKCTTVGST